MAKGLPLILLGLAALLAAAGLHLGRRGRAGQAGGVGPAGGARDPRRPGGGAGTFSAAVRGTLLLVPWLSYVLLIPLMDTNRWSSSLPMRASSRLSLILVAVSVEVL